MSLENIFGYQFVNTFLVHDELWHGEVLELSRLQTDSRTLISFERAGRMLAAMTILGITDLHFENVAMVRDAENGFYVPLDLEIVFKKFVSGIETALFPSQLADKSQCGLSAIFSHELGDNEVGQFLSGFFDTTEAMLPIAFDIVATIAKHMSGHPIRIILRPTKQYCQLLRGEPIRLEKPISNAERIQLNAGDIPYFFYFFNETETPRLLYFSTPLRVARCDGRDFFPDLASRYFFQRAAFLDQNRLASVIKATALHVARCIFAQRAKRSIAGENFSLDFDGSFLKFSTLHYCFGAKI